MLSRTATTPICLAAALIGARAHAQQQQTFPLATIEAEVPNIDTFTVTGTVPLGPNYTFNPVNCPFSLYKGGTRLLTQWEPVSYRADGTLATIEVLGVVNRGAMAVGSRQRFDLKATPSADPHLPLAAGAAFVSQMVLRSEDVYGNLYEGTFSSPTLSRLGAAEVTAEYETRLVPLVPTAPHVLPQLGAAQMWVSGRAGTDVFEVVLNYHNGSSQHPTWNIYFKRLELVFPGNYLAMAMLPENMAGATFAQSGKTVLPLIREVTGKMHFMEQRHEHEFRYFLYPSAAPGQQHADALRQRIGWGRALDVVSNPLTGTRTWSFVNAATPGYFPQGLPMPTLSHVSGLGTSLINTKNTLFGELTLTTNPPNPIHSVGETIPMAPGDMIPLPDCFRNPFGVQYGGMTGGQSINPYEGMETLWTGEKNGLLTAYAVLRSYTDRQPGAIYEDSGLSFRVDDPQYLNANGTQPYSIFNNVFQTQFGAPGGRLDAPWEWDQTDQTHEQQVQALGMVPAYRDTLMGWDPIDTQHMFRYSRMIKMLVYLDNDPLARRRLEAACQLIRATYYDGPGGRMSGMLSGTAGIGGEFGREHAETTDFAASAYACGDSAWRTSWLPWLDTVHDVLVHLQTPGGFWLASQFGKAATDPPFGNGTTSNFRVMQPREHMFTMHALRALEVSVFANGADAAREFQANSMLVMAGQAIWRLLWYWQQNLSGPAGNGTWDRVAVGPAGTVTPAQMYVTHADLPPEQWQPGVGLDSYQTGVGLTYWFSDAPTVTSEMQTALQIFWGSTDVLTAALAQGVSNIWNNAALIAYIQKHY